MRLNTHSRPHLCLRWGREGRGGRHSGCSFIQEWRTGEKSPIAFCLSSLNPKAFRQANTSVTTVKHGQTLGCVFYGWECTQRRIHLTAPKPAGSRRPKVGKHLSLTRSVIPSVSTRLSVPSCNAPLDNRVDVCEEATTGRTEVEMKTVTAVTALACPQSSFCSSGARGRREWIGCEAT